MNANTRRAPTSQPDKNRGDESRPGIDQSAVLHAADRSESASTTTSSTRTPRSQGQGSPELKIIQEQVGHENDSSTAIYTHVSDDFMNTMLHKALAPVLAPTTSADKDR
ncbi:hypothetical protein ABTY61_28795 [Kitasatospora sp. NPDC096128]|uniref:hypothetical protein n=1 Tax=Kitasatospora sp. NPDC096128 TaxID=3155547 RepID=UPI00331CA669